VRGESGLAVVDKPSGPTSHDVVDRVRRALGVRRVGHTGTLDPMATGVLPVLVGKATRLARFYSGGEKRYLARVRFGYATSTDDRTGEPLGPDRGASLERAALEEACRALTGELLQIPPTYSAKRVEGRRLYELARAGKPVPREASRVHVHRLAVGAIEGPEAELDVSCSAGTYVRSLARDLGDRLGLGGHLTALQRTESGGFAIGEAVALDVFEAHPWERTLPLRSLLPELPGVLVGEEGRAALLTGRDLPERLVAAGFPGEPPERLRVLGEDGELLALAVPRGFGPGAPGLPREPVLHPEIVLTTVR
jgi:tRNA pseudouridine55 synthase